VINLQFSPEAQRDLVRLEAFLWKASDPLAVELMSFVLDGLAVLTHQPGVGRPVGDGLRELIISRGRGGYLATYLFDPARQHVRVLRIRHQHEAGYTDQDI
jgi:plasmid stabilization system protein ParE